MNFYDKVHDMVRAFKDTEEYKKFLSLKNEIKQSKDKNDLLKNFKEKQNEMQMEYIKNNGKIDESKNTEMQNLYSILIQDSKIREYFETEMKLDIMIADMQKIIGEAVKEIVEY